MSFLRSQPIRAGLFVGMTSLLLLSAATLVVARSDAPRDDLTAERGGIGPDVTVIYVGSTSNYGASGGIRSYSVGTTSCNVGDAPLWWCDENEAYCSDDQHPVIAQNLYRLKEGRFEQLGQSWLKHGFHSTNTPDAACGTCTWPTHGGDQLGVGCTDTYGSGLNGARPLGLRSEVNSTTGALLPFPHTVVSSPSFLDQRLQVLDSDVDPALNAGAQYWVEGQYVAADDAANDKAFNNASYREVTVLGGSHDLDLQGDTVRELPAIAAWQAADAGVELVNADFDSGSGTERFHVARKVSSTEGASWHYEYVVHNFNSDRAAQSFSIDFPGAVTITGAGFKDVDSHSGEVYATTDWTVTVEPTAVSWSTVDFGTDPNANALRWGTLYNFWFDADAPPSGLDHTIELFKPGSPTSVSVSFPGLIFADGFESGDLCAWGGCP